MARPARIGKQDWAKHPTIGDCVLMDGSCASHQRAHAQAKPGKGRSLRERFPEIAASLDESASGFTADEVSAGASTVMAVWRCEQGHTYCATPNTRTNAKHPSNCGVCAGKVITPERSLAAAAPQIADQWDQKANGGKSPSTVAPQDNKRYWWRCEVAHDHRWQASPNNRVGKGSGCPFCEGQKASSTNNVTLSARLIQSWDRDGNGDLDPATLTLGSRKKVYWTCLKHPGDHEPWRAEVGKRYRGQDCGSCAGHTVTATNSLAARFPELADQVDPTLPPHKTADEISYGAQYEVHWRCPVWPEAHVWMARVGSRTANGTGCPDCATPGASKQEIRLMAELAAVLASDPTRHRVKGVPGPGGGRCDVDLIVPGLSLVIDFDGSFWHEDAEDRDREKSRRLQSAGWKVCRVREAPLERLGPLDVQVPMLAAAHEAASIVLEHLAACGVIDPGTARAYRSAGAPVASRIAEAEIQARMRAAGARTGRRGPLGETPGAPERAADAAGTSPGH